MATRTYRISLVGDSAHTEEAIRALGRLFEDAAVSLLAQQLSTADLSVQRLSGDENEVVLFVTPDASGSVMTQAAGADGEEVEPLSHGGGGSMSTEEPP